MVDCSMNHFEMHCCNARWIELVAQAKILNITLQTTKKEFVAFTEQQAKDFVTKTVDFRDRMDANGPVKCTDLDVGLQLLVQFQARFLYIFVLIINS